MSLAVGLPFDAAPFGKKLNKLNKLDKELGVGLFWEDPREIHKVVVRFKGTPPEDLKLQYWRRRWPRQRLTKDKMPEGGLVGWWELGNWFTGEWQIADADLLIDGSAASFSFRPINEKEFTDLSDFAVNFRTTLKLKLTSENEISESEMVGIEAYTDSSWDQMVLTALWQVPPQTEPSFEVFNGYVESVKAISDDKYSATIWRTKNADPNSFDKTLLTIKTDKSDETLTVLIDDLTQGPIYVPDYGLSVVAGEEKGDFAAVVSELIINSKPGVYDSVAKLPEQTWSRAWENMVPKKGRFYLPLGMDGNRHKFGLNPDGSVFYRTNVQYLVNCPGKDTSRLQADKVRINVAFGLSKDPIERTIQAETMPIGITTWEGAGSGGIRLEQVAFMTLLDGIGPIGSESSPPGDDFGVLIAKFSFQNIHEFKVKAQLPISFSSEGAVEKLRVDSGLIWTSENEKLRGYVDINGRGSLGLEGDALLYEVDLEPQDRHAIVIKLPYVPLEGDEIAKLKALDFEAQHEAVVSYWSRRLAEGMKLMTPEPMLNEFYQAHAGHLLINCEKEPNSEHRFARVGSFSYGVYGNESCMMIVDLDRRGYHKEAQNCLEAFLKYQGTVALPGDFSSKDGVLYGVCGYERGGYNQHHGWVLWCLVEHYKFTCDKGWLRKIASNLLSASEWIIRERKRTLNRDDIGRGLLPHGSLEDIGDWWQWLSTNVYTWRGLDAAAWGLERIEHAEAQRLRLEADAYRASIIRAFTESAQRSPVVKLKDGSYVPHYPSQVHRRGRTFGWICETLEGAIHLLITKLIDPNSKGATWILKDYEDNLYLSDHYGYKVENFDKRWFDLGGFSLQACLLLDVEPYLYRDDIKQALRATFNAIAAYYFPDTRMITEHALVLGEWRGDHYKSSDEANAAGWLRYLFIREKGDELILGQAVPRDWLKPGNRVGVENAATHFGKLSLVYESDDEGITATLRGLKQNSPSKIRLRFRLPERKKLRSFQVNGKEWFNYDDEWVYLPGDVEDVKVRARIN